MSETYSELKCPVCEFPLLKGEGDITLLGFFFH